MAAKKGLGKGLDSLIADKVSTKPAAKETEKKKPTSEHAADAVMMDITKVEPNREQPRKKFDEDALLELAESIKQFGVLQPLLVQERDDYYEIIAGERRWRAAKMAGVKKVPVIIKKLTEQEIMEIRRLTDMDFRFIAVKVNNWNQDLSPWNAEAVFGTEEFGNGARATLDEVLKLCTDTSKYYCIGGYSMAGLFALWTAMQTNQFDGIAAASPSIWFPGFLEYMKRQKVQSNCIYLSLGDKEEKTRNAVMAQVGNCIRQAYAWLAEEGIQCTLEWNQGGHFKEPDIRTARAFAWVMKNLTRK